MIRGLVLCLSGFILMQSASVADQAKPGKLRDNTIVERFESRPDLAIKFEEVAQLKIASRKSMFHVGEMITLDIALLNTSSRPLFFRELSEFHINAMTPTGRKTAVQAYGAIDRAVVPSSFVRVAPGEIIVHSFQLLAGCDKRAFAQFSSSEDDDRTVFNRGLFLNWGDACLPITQPETYMLSVEVKNNFVLLPSHSGKVRTAVGKIKSNSFELTIGN